MDPPLPCRDHDQVAGGQVRQSGAGLGIGGVELLLVLVLRVATHGIDACENHNTSSIVLDTDFVARSAKPLRKPCDLRPGEADVRQVDRLNVNHNSVLENFEIVGRHRSICVCAA